MTKALNQGATGFIAQPYNPDALAAMVKNLNQVRGGDHGCNPAAAERKTEEERRKELLDNLPYGAALYEYDGRTLSAVHHNKRYWELVGRSPVEYKNASYINSVFIDDRPIVHLELNAAIMEKRDVACDIRVLCGDGKYRPFHITGRITHNTEGSLSIYAVYTPVTDEVMSYQRMLPIALGAMMDSQKDYLLVKDRNLRYVCCSKKVSDLAGLSSQEEMTGKSDYDLFDSTIAEGFANSDRRVIESGEPLLDVIDRLPSRDGQAHYARVSKYPLKDSNGAIVGVYSIGMDVTRQLAAKAQFELLQSSIMGGIATYEYRAGRYSVTYFSEGFCSLFEVTREEYAVIVDGDVFAGIFKEDIPELRRQFGLLVSEDKRIDVYFRIRLITGKYKWINMKAEASERIADKVVFNGIFFDVTERQDTLTRLRAREEENRLAVRHTRSTVCRYDIASKVLTQQTNGGTETTENVPDSNIDSGVISAGTAAVYRRFYQDIAAGREEGKAVYQVKSESGWRWVEAYFTNIFSNDGKPRSAVISFSDISARVEKESAGDKRTQQLHTRAPETDSPALCADDTQSGKTSTGMNGKAAAQDGNRGRRMLIVDGSDDDFSAMKKIFEDSFIIDRAKDSTTAMFKLRRYGSSISIVITDMKTHSAEGFSVIRNMRQSAVLRAIPVIAVSGPNDKAAGIKAVMDGAADFVVRPVDTDILRARALSAISRSESERQRAINYYMQMKNEETIKYTTVLERTDTAIIEYDWLSGASSYSPNISKLIKGVFDKRGLWRILLADKTADANTVKRLHTFIRSIGDSRGRMEDRTDAELTTPEGESRAFSFRVYKIAGELGLTKKLIIAVFPKNSHMA